MHERIEDVIPAKWQSGFTTYVIFMHAGLVSVNSRCKHVPDSLRYTCYGVLQADLYSQDQY
jgi:hypothetical protein